MSLETSPLVRKQFNIARQLFYDCETAFDRGDRDAVLRLAKELIVCAGHLANLIARWYFPARTNKPIDRSYGLFPPSAPPSRHAEEIGPTIRRSK